MRFRAPGHHAFMNRAVPFAALALMLAAPVQAQDPQKLAMALLVEWQVANCPLEQADAMAVTASNLIINGSPEAEVTKTRKVIQDGMRDNYKSVAEGCEDIRAKN